MAIKKNMNAFDDYLHAMQHGRASLSDKDAAIAVYDRARAARAIYEDLLPGKAVSPEAMAALVSELRLEATWQKSQGSGE